MLLGGRTAVQVVIYHDRHRRRRKYHYVWVQSVVLVLSSERLKIVRYRRRRLPRHLNVLGRLSTEFWLSGGVVHLRD